MRNLSFSIVFSVGGCLLLAGCASTQRSAEATTDASDRGAGSGLMFDAQNPTAQAGRGEPSLEDKERPAAWIYIDGQEGRFETRNGIRQLQWIVDGPVSPTPTFRVAVFQPLLGNPTSFKGVLQTDEAKDGSYVSYGIAAKDGAFRVGRDYALTAPGEEFTVRVAGSDEVIEQIAPLAPGRYALAAKITNSRNGAETLAVTYFTVGEPTASAGGGPG